MTRHLPTLRLVLVAVLVAGVMPPSDAAGASPETKALERALKLLPHRPPVPIRFVDPELVADPDAVRRADAFLVREPDGRIRQVIYLNSRSSVVQQAAIGRDLDIAILAAVIQHEMEHLRGGGEQEARRVEREFFQSLVFGGRVPRDEGLAYLQDLVRHHRLHKG